MTPILNTILIIVAALCMVGALYFLFLGLRNRSEVPESSYGVERQEVRHIVLASYFRGGFLFCLGLIMVAIIGIGNYPGPAVTEDNDLSDPGIFAPADDEAANPTATRTANPTSAPSPTSPVPTLTATTSPTPLPTDTPIVIIAIVASPNGLWLRERPGGTQEVELIADGAELIVLNGNEVVDGTEWQLVRTPSGLEGWVANEYIQVNQ